MKVFLFLLTCSAPLIAQKIDHKLSVHQRIQSIPLEERKVVEGFFRRLFYHGDFSYTLLGLKPMGSIDYSLSHLCFPVFYKNPKQHLYLMALDEKDWKVWERYQHLFPMEKYSFVKIEKEGSFGFLLVNKEKSYAVIEKNLQLFQDLTGKKVCPRVLLHILCQGQLAYSFSSAPCSALYYQALGLLYGYGEENVQVFIEREQLLQTLSHLPLDVKNLPPEIARYLERIEISKMPAKSPSKADVTSLVFALKKLLQKNHFVKGTKKDNPFLPIKRSLFFGSEEYTQTQALIESWDKVNSSIVKIYESDIFLETILGMLTTP
jgi:hypothetical protein